MEVKVFNSSIEEIKKKSFNIFIGISVGVKPLNEKIAKSYLDWCLKYTKEDVVILIADEIAKYNYIVFSSYNENKSLNRAYRDGKSHKEIFEQTIETYFLKEKNRIKIIHWTDILSEKYIFQKGKIDNFFESKKEFREKISYFLEKYTERRNKKLSRERMRILSNYILSELPTILDGIEYGGKKYDLLFYPTYVHSGLSELSVNIQNGAEFKELKENLNLEKKSVMVEAYIKEN
jgi:tRNA-dependent cyclodipeptide synthase